MVKSQIERLFVESVRVRFLYVDGGIAYLQNPETFDQVE
jgi:translation elongation factor P/translation initiation factor 5A